MADLNHLFGSCACERNVFEIQIPQASTSLAQVFFDNSQASRRVQATPITAWLRIPLDWYQSSTTCFFPDESHSSIKRSYNTPSTSPLLPPTRRQFCGYCGTALTAWNEALHAPGYGENRGHGYLDVTLGSLLDESLDKLEALKIIDNESSDEEERSSVQEGGGGGGDNDGLVKGGTIDDEDHIPSNERTSSGVDGQQTSRIPVRTSRASRPPHRMGNRGMPYFEEMVEHSRLGRIKRQTGGGTSRDGTTSVHWEIVEIGGEEPASSAADAGGNKRQKLGQ